jgi:hypothetical protein
MQAMGGHAPRLLPHGSNPMPRVNQQGGWFDGYGRPAILVLSAGYARIIVIALGTKAT